METAPTQHIDNALALASSPLSVYTGDFARALVFIPPAETMTNQELDGYQELFANVVKDVGRLAVRGQVEMETRARKALAS